MTSRLQILSLFPRAGRSVRDFTRKMQNGELDPRWREVFDDYSLATSHFFKVWTLQLDHAREFQRRWNQRLDPTQPKRYVESVEEGDYYGVALSMCDLNRMYEDQIELPTLVLLREAVELLHMLACIDLDLWREVFTDSFALKDSWRDRVVPVWAFMPYDVLARSVDIANSDVEFFFSILQQTPRTNQYHRSKNLMLEILGADVNPLLRPRLPEEMEMKLLLIPPVATFVPRSKLASHLHAVREALDQASITMPSTNSLPIKVVSVHVSIDDATIDVRSLESLAYLSSVVSVDFLKFDFRQTDADDGVYPWSTFGNLMTHAVIGCDNPHSARTFAVNMKGGDFRRFISFASALRETQCTATVTYTAESVAWPREKWLRWLAWSWLGNSKHSPSLNLCLYLDKLTTDDVEILHAVVTGGNPVSALAPPVRWIITTADVMAMCEIDTTEEITTTISPGTRLAVVGESAGHGRVTVVVPGYGTASLDRVDVEMTTKATGSSLSPHPRVRVTGLNLTITGDDPESLQGATALIQLLGPSITDLMVMFERQQLRQEEVELIMPSCPSLEKLKLIGLRMCDLSPVIEYISRPSSRLENLVLNRIKLLDSKGLSDFIIAASKPTTHLASILKIVGFGFTKDTLLEADTMETVHRMLEVNRRLKGFQMCVPCQADSNHRSYVDDQTNELVARPAEMIPLASKLAFIHVLKALDQSTISSAASKLALNHLAISHIFEFAAKPSLRTVIVEFDRSY